MKFYTDGSSTAGVKSAYCVVNENDVVLEHQESIPPKTNNKAPIVITEPFATQTERMPNPYKGEDGKWYYYDECNAPSEAYDTELEAKRALNLYVLYLNQPYTDCMPTPKMVHQCACAKGWWDKPRGIPELLCLIHSEVSEALEAYRNRIEPGAKGWIGEELADIIIRVYDMAEYLEIDIEEEVKNKFVINLKRPYRHGNKEC